MLSYQEIFETVQTGADYTFLAFPNGVLAMTLSTS
jgi:hypothetical protein